MKVSRAKCVTQMKAEEWCPRWARCPFCLLDSGTGHLGTAAWASILGRLKEGKETFAVGTRPVFISHCPVMSLMDTQPQPHPHPPLSYKQASFGPSLLSDLHMEKPSGSAVTATVTGTGLRKPLAEGEVSVLFLSFFSFFAFCISGWGGSGNDFLASRKNLGNRMVPYSPDSFLCWRYY